MPLCSIEEGLAAILPGISPQTNPAFIIKELWRGSRGSGVVHRVH